LKQTELCEITAIEGEIEDLAFGHDRAQVGDAGFEQVCVRGEFDLLASRAKPQIDGNHCGLVHAERDSFVQKSWEAVALHLQLVVADRYLEQEIDPASIRNPTASQAGFALL